MKLLIQLFWWSMDFNIDRIEGEFAIIEWSNQRYSVLPVELFVRPPQEQESYRFTIRKKIYGQWLLSKGDPIVLRNDRCTVIIPAESSWRLNVPVEWSLQLLPHSSIQQSNALLLD